MAVFEIALEFVNEKLWLTAFIFMLHLRSNPRRSHFALKSVLGLAGVFVLGLLPRLLWQQYPEWPLLSAYLSLRLYIWPLLLSLYMRVLFSSSWNMMLLPAVAGLCAQEVVFGLWALLQVAFSLPAGLVELFATSVLSLCLALVLYKLFGSRLTARNLQLLHQRSLFPMLALYILAILLVSQVSDLVLPLIRMLEPIRSALAAAGVQVRAERLRTASILTNVVGNVLVLFALFHMLRYSEADLERELLEQIREQDRKQYAHFRDNVDYINTKSHDLKHYLSLLQGGEKLPAQELRQVSESISHLDAETDSGNETLDLILTDRRLACQRRGIELIFQTDGTRLEQLDVIDTYAIFCNILDNAVEYAAGLPEGERQIRLGLRTIHGMVFIHQENPLNGALTMEGGLPVTTQKNPILHGFGLKSVQSTVKKWGGELAIRAENGRFELDICFPREITEA